MDNECAHRNGKEIFLMYTVKRHTAEIAVAEYLKDYVDIDGFLECCKECPNYNNVWTCPPFEFDPLEYWKQYDTLEVYAQEIIFDEKYAGKCFSKSEMSKIIEQSIKVVKNELTDELFELEKDFPGSVSLSAGSCIICAEGCTKKDGKDCRFPEKQRYSIEALGGNVGLTISKLMGIDIEWVKEDILPSKFVLVCGLLKKS